MVYCRFRNNVVGSSNIKDVTDYCNQYGITFLTTNDFLFYGIKNELITAGEATQFIAKVRSLGSYPPVVDFSTYVCNKLLYSHLSHSDSAQYNYYSIASLRQAVIVF